MRTESPALAEAVEHDKAHGRVTTRRAQLFSLVSLTLDARWDDSGLSALMVVERETFKVSTQKTSFETSYYVSNQVPEPSTAKSLAGELAQAVRGHWGVESNNWIRDATFGEDGIKTKAGNQAQVMGLLRGGCPGWRTGASTLPRNPASTASCARLARWATAAQGPRPKAQGPRPKAQGPRPKAPSRRRPPAWVADGPNQLWSWDITYLASTVAGLFVHLYLI